MIDRINFRSLNELLLEHKYFFVSFDTFKQRVLSHELRVAREFFLEQEDYHLLAAMQSQEDFFKKKYIYINIFEGKRLFITKDEFYSKTEYEPILRGTGIKLTKEQLDQYIRIANGY